MRQPFWPLAKTDFGRKLTSDVTKFERSTRVHAKPLFDLEQTKFRGEIVKVEEETIDLSSFCRLIHFKRVSDNINLMERTFGDPKILLVAPYFGHFATLMRGTVEALLPSHNVYITDWTDAKMVPLRLGTFNLDDQIDYLIHMIRKLGEDVHIVAAHESCVPALCAVALLAKAEKPFEPRTLTLIGGAVDPQRATSPLSEMALTHPLFWFKETQIDLVPAYYPGAFRSVYPGFMQLQSGVPLSVDPRVTEQIKYFDYLTRGCDEESETLEQLYDEFVSVMDVPAELYLQYIERVYQQAALPSGTFVWREKKVDLAAIRNTALLTVAGELDDLLPPEQTRAALALCSGLSEDKKMSHLEIGVGHYGVFTGRKWRNTIQPAIHKFIRQHSLSAQDVEDAIG